MADTPSADYQEGSGVLKPFVDRPREPLPTIVAPEPPQPVVAQPEPSPPPAPESPEPPAPVAPVAPVAVAPVPPAAAVHVAPQPIDPPLVEAIDPEPLLKTDGPPRRPADERLLMLPPDNSGKLVLSKKIFGIGMLVIAIVIAGLAFMWVTSGDDVANTAPALPTATDVAPSDSTSADGGPTVPEDSDQPGESDTADGDGAAIEALQAEVDALKTAIAAIPAPALPGSSLQRIVVSAEASFVSASDTSVAVVGPFGNYANIDPATNAVTAAGQVAAGATRVIRTPTSVWLTNYHDGQLIWVDPVTNAVNQIFDFPGPDGLAKDGKSLIVSSFDDGFVARFDPGVGKAIEQVGVGGSPTAVAVDGQGGIWATVFDTGELVRIDPSTFTVTDRIPVGAGPVGLAISEGTVWVSNNQEGTVVEVSIAERKVVTTLGVGLGPTELLVVGDSVWVAVTDAGDLVQIGISDSLIVTRTPLGGVLRSGGPTGISFGAGSIWVAIEGEQSVVRITPPA